MAYKEMDGRRIVQGLGDVPMPNRAAISALAGNVFSDRIADKFRLKNFHGHELGKPASRAR